MRSCLGPLAEVAWCRCNELCTDQAMRDLDCGVTHGDMLAVQGWLRHAEMNLK